jgi:hypothetical protein
MLRGLARSDGFAVIAPGTDGAAGDRVAVRTPTDPAREPAMTVHTALTTDPLDVAAHEALVAHPAAGAVVSFAGVVRDHDGGAG